MTTPKDPDVAATYAIDWQDVLIAPLRRRETYATGALVFAPIDTGFFYACTTAGRTAARYPTRWPREAGETVADGSVTWTCRAPDDVTENAVDSAVWTLPSGITKDSQTESGFKTFITLSGGTDGEDYEITCRMTPVTGNPEDKTITVQVRAQ